MRAWPSVVLALALILPLGCSKDDNPQQSIPDPGPTCVAGGTTPLPSPDSTDFRLVEVPGATGLLDPIDLQAPSGDARLFVALRGGLICIVQGGVLLPTPFLDLRNRVQPVVSEDGFISFAFDPQFSTNRFVYVHFIDKTLDANGDIVVERYQASASNPNVLQTPGTEVIRVPHRQATNHYGGHVFIGPDGMLYLSTGDGGAANNVFGHAQDAASLLGKMLRIDVSTLPYTVPADNPSWPGVGRNEVWAIGLRNPFRYAFDGSQLYIADVGQNQREEIDVVDASVAGLNYGWSIMEGTQCFPSGGSSCNMTGLTLPVYDYDHGAGCAIIGGYVYRGSAIAALQGKYLFSDLCTGFVRTLAMGAGGATVTEAPTINVGHPLSFGRDGSGEIYVLTAESRVLKFVP
jgi:glucose/arabinose dehydrogenase